MCGIFATTNDPDSAQTILAGLKRLEYRGYDSWGIAVKGKTNILIDKHIGKISRSQTRLPKSLMGIGHTRWATHGGVTAANAHPHLDCTGKLALVHNGIIDNWQKLLPDTKTHPLKSQTDSEIVAHLIEALLQTGLDLIQAAQKVLPRLQGLNAFLFLHADYPYLVVAKTGSPLVVGYFPGHHLVASDVASLLPLTQKVIYLEDDQIAQIYPQKIIIKSLSTGRRIKAKITSISWSATSAQKGKYRHFMLKEIHEQPAMIQHLARTKTKDALKLSRLIKTAKGTFTVACGSAAYAALAGQYFFSRIARQHINPAIGSEFYYHADFLNKKSLCIALSQSGETIDTLQSIKHAQQNQAQTVAIVNVPGSSLDRLCHHHFYLDAGPEKAVASTKAFTAKLGLLLLTAHQLHQSVKAGQKELTTAVIAIKKLLHPSFQSTAKKLAQKIKDSTSIFILGKGQSYPAALETALKIKEISYIHAEGFPSGELKHGVLALITHNTPVLVYAPKDETFADVISAAMEVKARGGHIIGVSHQNNPVFDTYLPVADAGNATIIPNVVLGQILAYHLAVLKKLDPDMPRNLAKSVVVK